MIGASLIAGPDLDLLAALAAIAPRGALVEVGVYRGGSAARLWSIAQAQGRALHLYDTFRGHPVVDPARDNPHVHPEGRYGDDAIDPEVLRRDLPGAVVHVGTFPHTLADMGDVAFVHLDCDLYWPTLRACQMLPAQMVSGAILYVDDYSRAEGCPGVRAAVRAVFGDVLTLPNGNGLVMPRPLP